MRTILILSNLILLQIIAGISPTAAQRSSGSSENVLMNYDEQPDNKSDQVSYRFFTHFNRGSDIIPFWFYANTHGALRPGSKVNSISGIALNTHLTPNDSSFDIRLGTTLVNRISDLSNTLHFQQLFGEVQYLFAKLKIGRFYRMTDFDKSIEGLTTGFMVESHNATPYPRISLETDGFTPIPGTGKHLQLRLYYSDGILESDRFISSPYIHHKSLQVRSDINRLSIQFGIFHSVMWAGKDRELGQLPRSFKDYLRVVLSRSGNEGSNAPYSDQLNRLGNSVGVYEFGVTYRAQNFKLLGYRHLFLEDELSVKFQSPWDGIWGIGIVQEKGKHLINTVIYEHLNSIQQESRKNLAQGRASFYNNGIYKDGWAYKGRLMGNPLFTYNPDKREVVNNIMIAHHLGIKGYLTERVSYQAMITYSRNYGVCRDQIIEGRCSILPGDSVPDNLELRPRSELRGDRLSGILRLQFLLLSDQNLYLHSSFAADSGDFWQNRYGFMLGISISG